MRVTKRRLELLHDRRQLVGNVAAPGSGVFEPISTEIFISMSGVSRRLIEPRDGAFDGGDVLREIAHGDRVHLVVDAERGAFETAAEELDRGCDLARVAVVDLEDFTADTRD